MRPFWPRVSPHFLACRRSLAPFSTPALIGLSGGPDSLALVAAAAAEAKDVRVLVVDHGLQEGSDEVAGQAAAQAAAWGVPTEVQRVRVEAGKGESLEAAARTARYAALAEAARASGRDIWVAHTLDDQAETLLLGALRANPAGMSEVSQLDQGVALVRPFLGLRRADTVGACAELGVEPWHDPMNDDPAFRRVAIRQQILPALGEILGGDAAPALARTADRIAADQSLLSELVDLSPTTDCAVLAADSVPIRQRRIMAWLRTHDVSPSGAQLAGIERLCTSWHGQGPVTLSGGVRIARRAGQLVVEKASGGRG